MAITLEQARERIRHVVVVMLENRSFDHLLGYAGPPGVEQPGDGHANPVDCADPSQGAVPPSPTAEHILALDPPHSHASAKQQMGIPKNGVYPMTGFVDAYRLKKLHREHLPVIHWNRIRGVAVGVSPIAAAAAGLLSDRARSGEWAGFEPWAAGGLLAAAGIASAKPLARAGDIPWYKLVSGVLAAGVGLGAAGEGLARFAKAPRWTAAPLAAGAATVLLGAVQYFKRRDAEKRKPLEGSAADQATCEARQIMRCMPPDKVKVLSQLAREFTTCSHWHASVPGATWPNRNFLHAGTSEQAVDIEPGFYRATTIFELLDCQRRLKAGTSSTLTNPPWKIYRDGLPQVIVFEKLLENELADRWCDFEDFEADCEAGELPTYSFIEPRHDGGGTNSMHPGNNQKATEGSTDFARGERLVQRVYEALRQGKGNLFERTLLVITFDEHGGFFDHESPPAAVHPDRVASARHPITATRRLVSWFVEHKNAPFDFKRYGVRVPAVIVSPWVEAKIDPTLYDHTSVIATLHELFTPDQEHLGERARKANTFWHLVSSSAARPMPIIPAPDYPLEATSEDTGPVEHTEARKARPRLDDDLLPQLEAMVPLIEARLDRLGAPSPSFVEDAAEPASPLDRVDARLRLWASGESPTATPT